jgi:hypothetical protein
VIDAFGHFTGEFVTMLDFCEYYSQIFKYVQSRLLSSLFASLCICICACYQTLSHSCFPSFVPYDNRDVDSPVRFTTEYDIQRARCR